jgi:hypothetical protein
VKFVATPPQPPGKRVSSPSKLSSLFVGFITSFEGLTIPLAGRFCLQRFSFQLACEPEEVGMVTGATIHTKGGLPMRILHRRPRVGV